MANFRTILAILIIGILTGCEEDLTLELPVGEPMLIVEGHIEQSLPPVLILTRSVPLFTGFTNKTLEDSFVHGADIIVTHKGQPYPLREIPLINFSNELKEIISLQFGVPEEFLNSKNNFPFYVYTTNDLKGKLGGSYGLSIRHEGKVLSSTTTIPQLNPLDSLWTQPHPDPKQDSLKILFYRYIDPDTLGNSIRYATKRNNEPFYPGLFGSVFNDELVNGGRVIFPLDRGEPRGQAKINRELYGYFGKGDTVVVRWSAIDLAHFRFWNTLESEQNSNGSPIGSPNITRTNIKGGLGIWGGYSSSYHTIVIK